MLESEFNILSEDLRTLARKVPLRWGAVQNNHIDDKINMFRISSFAELEDKLKNLSEEEQRYLSRRWYLWKCSECDEYLFYKNLNVVKNPNRYDKEWDICIDGNYKFDIKGTVIPKSFRTDVDSVLKDPTRVIDFFYDEQSRERRFDIQNRLFIIHHSFVSPEREFYLRCAWHSKDIFYKHFCENINRVKMFKTHNVTAAVIFLLEKERGVTTALIPGLQLY